MSYGTGKAFKSLCYCCSAGWPQPLIPAWKQRSAAGGGGGFRWKGSLVGWVKR